MSDTDCTTIELKDKTRDHFAALTARPVSEVARDLCDALCVEIMAATGDKALASRKAAFGALVSDLIEGNPKDADGWLYRSLRSNTFNGGDVGYRPFIHVSGSADAGLDRGLAGDGAVCSKHRYGRVDRGAGDCPSLPGDRSSQGAFRGQGHIARDMGPALRPLRLPEGSFASLCGASRQLRALNGREVQRQALASPQG